MEEEVLDLQRIMELENRYLQSPWSEEGVPEEVIEMVECKIGYKLPFHLREFIKITNGRRINLQEEMDENSKDLMGSHWSWLNAFQDWRFHSPQKVQIGFIDSSTRTMTGGNGLFIDLKSGMLSDGLKSLRMNFKQWMQSSCSGKQVNLFNVQKVLSNEKDLRTLLKQYGYLYEYLTESQKNDKKLINLAIQSYPILQFAPNSIRNEKSIVQLAIKYHTENYTHISDPLKKDKDILKQFIERGGSLSGIPSDLINNDLILESLKNGSIVDENILRKSTTSDEFLIKLIGIVKPSSNPAVGNFLTQLSKESKLSEKVLKQIIESDPASMSIIGLGDKIQMNKKVALKIFESTLYDNSHSIKLFTNLPKDLQSDKEIAEKAVLSDFDIYPTLDETLKKDRPFNLQLLTNWLKHSNSYSNTFSQLKPLYDFWGQDETFLRLAFNTSPEFVIDFPKLLAESFINSLQCHFGKLSFGEILKIESPYEAYRLAVRRNKSHPAHDLVEAKDTLKDIRMALPKEDDPETLADIRQSLLSSVWYDYW